MTSGSLSAEGVEGGGRVTELDVESGENMGNVTDGDRGLSEGVGTGPMNRVVGRLLDADGVGPKWLCVERLGERAASEALRFCFIAALHFRRWTLTNARTASKPSQTCFLLGLSCNLNP